MPLITKTRVKLFIYDSILKYTSIITCLYYPSTRKGQEKKKESVTEFNTDILLFKLFPFLA